MKGFGGQKMYMTLWIKALATPCPSLVLIGIINMKFLVSTTNI